MTNFYHYFRNGFGFNNAFYISFGFTFKQLLIECAWGATVLAILTAMVYLALNSLF